MSLILEALRKSEAQRRRATVPDVFAELPPAPAARSHLGASRVAWIALVALLLALWIARTALAPATPATAPAARIPRIAPQVPSLPPVRHLSPPPASPARTEPDVPMADKTDATTRPSPPVRIEPISTDPARAPATTTATATAPITPPPVTAAPAMTAMTSPAATQSLSDLSVDERKALPPLKMSMHLWNDDPAQRLVIIDGNRLHEGDRIGDAVVTAIVADGVLLDWNGRRLKLPIR
ncbi:general secretion pathway protein GspB [Cognatiluteimonas profundi]|uniref:general secretion pathway protein GspB n=1 Tax=Cognatiluteimonas profundi TaxID=2594501 RepID=UPI00131EAF74|nr:general secretion pathway protein GspB [Lysobacter profundi]